MAENCLWESSVVLVLAFVVAAVVAAPLDDYVNRADPHYNYHFLTSYRGPDYDVHVLNMTSQKWLTDGETNRAVWWHYLNIVIPTRLDYNGTGILWIDGGKNTDRVPTLSDRLLQLVVSWAVSSGTVAAIVKMIPNQPVVFKSDPKQLHRVEDFVLAWSWEQFMDNRTSPHPDSLIWLPMTKACVRAMDTVTKYTQQVTGHKVSKFFISGASKRGWTCWLTAAVDKRVIGFAPVVMNLLHMTESLHHMYRAYGGWTFAFAPYYKANITAMLDTPEFKKTVDIIDPMSYNSRYFMKPKLIISAAGDEFFMLDNTHYFYKQLQGPKFLRLVPNAEHTLIGHILSVKQTVQAFYLHLLQGVRYPKVTWERSQTPTGGKIVVHVDTEPSQVTMYHARTLGDLRRDFRLVILDQKTKKIIFHPVLWHRGQVKKLTAFQFEAELDKPPTGWAAFFVQLTFLGAKNSSLEVTTDVQVVPDTYPFPDCSGHDCHGTLI